MRWLEITRPHARFVLELAEQVEEKAQQDLRELHSFACEVEGRELPPLEWEDLGYFRAKQTRRDFNFDLEKSREYFDEESTLKGIVELTRNLFGVELRPDSSIETWHDDVRAFRVFDTNGQEIGYLFFDLFERSGKIHKAGEAGEADSLMPRLPRI